MAMTTHAYEMTKTESGATIVVCSECGPRPEGIYPDAEGVVAFVQVHDRYHAVQRSTRPGAVTLAEIEAWLSTPDAGIWEPTARERAGHVAVPLGHVILADAIAAAAEHECPAIRRANGYEYDGVPVTVRILDVHGKATDHVLVDDAALDAPCITPIIVHDPRVSRCWLVRKLDPAVPTEGAATP